MLEETATAVEEITATGRASVESAKQGGGIEYSSCQIEQILGISDFFASDASSYVTGEAFVVDGDYKAR